MRTLTNNLFYSLVVVTLITGTLSADAGDFSPAQSENQTTVPEWVVIDGTRNISYNMVLLLVEKEIPCTVIVRPSDMAFADSRLPQSPLINLVQYDYTQLQITPEFEAIGAGAKYLFLDPEYDAYKEWHKIVPIITRNAIKLAKKNQLTIFYPARVYVFNNHEVITHESSYNPITSQGLTLMKIEYLLKKAADTQVCKVRQLRMSYAFGKGIFEYLLSNSFKNIPNQGQLLWLFETQKAHQFCYATDVCRIMLQMSSYRTEEPFYSLHYSGYTYESVEAFGHAICQIARVELKPRIISESLLAIACFFNSDAERGADLTAYFKQPVLMEDSQELIQDFNFVPTAPEIAFKETLDWFATHDLPKRGPSRNHFHRGAPHHLTVPKSQHENS